MAEGGAPETKGEVEGSDQSFTFECDSCKYDGTVAEGVVFCVVCKEYMCRPCWKTHGKLKSTRNHEVLEGENIKTAVDIKDEDRDVYFCNSHSGNKLTLYCRSHDDVLCQLCRLQHTSCKNVQTIQEVSDKEYTNEETKTYVEEMKVMMKNISELQTKREEDKQILEEKQEGCFQEIDELRETMNNILDRLQRKLKENVREFILTECKSISEQISTLSNVRKLLQECVYDLEMAIANGDTKRYFLARKRLCSVKVELIVKELDTREARIDIEANKMLMTFLERLEDIGNLKIEGSCAFRGQRKLQDTPILNEQREKKRLLCTNQTILAANIWKADFCDVRHLIFLNESDLLMCDYSNNKLKLIPFLRNIINSVLYLSGKPFCLTLVSETKVAVSIPESKMLHYITLTPQMKRDGEVDIGRPCFGLAFHKETTSMYVACYDNQYKGEILVINKKGETTGKIGGKTEDGSYKFLKPDYITIHKEQLYVSDSKTKLITCMSLQGISVFTYSDTGLKCPRGFLVDSRQHVYVCDSESNNIQVITSDGKKYGTLLTSVDGVECPCAIAYSESQNTIVVGMQNKAFIRVFKLV